MTEFDYDVKSRKALVPSARRRKNGVKSKKCTLPSDYMTKKEQLAMNGELTSINMNKPYELVQLRTFPIDLQREYVRNLKERFHLSVRMFAELAGCGYATANKYLTKELGIKFSNNDRRATAQDKEEFKVFVHGYSFEQEEKVEPVSIAEPEIKKSGFAAPKSATLVYSGSVREVCEALVYALGAGSAGEFEITFKREVEPEC